MVNDAWVNERLKIAFQRPAIVSQQLEPAATNSVTFTTSENAPGSFDAWTFFWKCPGRDSDAKLDQVIIHPNGKEFVFDFSGIRAGGSGRSDWQSNNADKKIRDAGNPAVFRGQPISISFRASQGNLRLAGSNYYWFAFCSRSPDEKVDWGAPFKTVRAVKN